MERTPFKFKQFDIFQDKTAMKVGTDAVLLGAYVEFINPNRILDIGTGTGLVALMMAQKFGHAKIDAVEIETEAYNQAKENFQISTWSDRLEVFQKDFKVFEPNYRYDLIVSNPPFYNATFKKLDEKRATARHTQQLDFKILLKKTSQLLAPKGSFFVIIPFYESENFVALAKTFGLFPQKILNVKGNQNSAFKRSILEFTFQEKEISFRSLVIEKSRNNYTDEYIQLTKDFYLKM